MENFLPEISLDISGKFMVTFARLGEKISGQAEHGG